MDFKREWKGYKRVEVDAYIRQLNETHAADNARQQESIAELKERVRALETELRSYEANSGTVSKALESAVAKADEIERLSKLKYRQEMEQLKVFHEKWLSYYKKLLKQYPLDEELRGLSSFNRSMSAILDSGETPPVEQFERESARVGKQQRIGYIDVDAGESSLSDDEIMKEILPDLPAGETEFNPEERVREYLSRAAAKEKSAAKPVAKPAKKTPSKAPAGRAAKMSAPAEEYADRSESGFSFEEALHPTEDLADIMRDLGLFTED